MSTLCLSQFLFLIISYLISAIPFGLLISRLFAGQDIRNYGSGNIGATNVTRVIGKKLGLVTLILDGLKGAAMIIIARIIFSNGENLELFLVLVGGISVIGHIFPVYIKFKGGKGVATAIAVLLAINPVVGLVNILAWLIIFTITKISAAASISSIIIATIFAIYYDVAIHEIALYIFLSALILIRHKENISRILQGKENKFR